MAGRDSAKSFGCSIKHPGQARIHFEETLQKLYREKRHHPSIPTIEIETSNLNKIRDDIFKRYGKLSEQEIGLEEPCARCVEELTLLRPSSNPNKTFINTKSENKNHKSKNKNGDNTMLGKIMDWFKGPAFKEIYLPEGIAHLTEMPVDIVFTKIGAKLTKFFGSIGLFIAARKMPAKAKFLDEMASHLLAESVDSTPKEMAMTVFGAREFGKRLSAKDFAGAGRALWKTPREMSAEFGALKTSFAPRPSNYAEPDYVEEVTPPAIPKIREIEDEGVFVPEEDIITLF